MPNFAPHPHGLFEEEEFFYHRQGCVNLSSHKLHAIRQGKQHEVVEVKPHHRFGRWCHACTLEGMEAFLSRAVIGAVINPKTGNPYGLTSKKYEEWAGHIKEVYGEETEAVPYDSFEMVKKIAKAVQSLPHMREVLASGVPESVGRTIIEGVRCQIRCDWLHVLDNDIHLYDLKTTREIYGFTYDAINYGYLYQLAFYRRVLREITGLPVEKCYLVPVEKEGDFPKCDVIEMDSQQLDECDEDNLQWIKKIAQDKISPFTKPLTEDVTWQTT